MNKITGFLIRQKRLSQNISQEGLCKGICVVSYLSKIEQGLVNPSPEIIQQLFAVLQLKYYDDEAFIKTYEKQIHAYIESYFYHEDIQENDEIEAAMEQLLQSPLIIDILLYNVIKSRIHENSYELYMDTLHELSIYEAYMSDKQRFLYYLLHVDIQDIKESIHYVEIAD